MRYAVESLRRFFGKFVLDIVPAALASAIGGLVLAHYAPGGMQETAAATGAPASVEMMQLLRDEHELMSNYLKTQLAKEKHALLTENGASSAADPEPAAGPPQQIALAAVAAKPIAPHGRTAVAGALLPPLVIAQTRRQENLKPTSSQDSLIARTIGIKDGIKDNVVAVTHRVVSAITGLPSWIGAIGGHIGGFDMPPQPPAELVSAS